MRLLVSARPLAVPSGHGQACGHPRAFAPAEPSSPGTRFFSTTLVSQLLNSKARGAAPASERVKHLPRATQHTGAAGIGTQLIKGPTLLVTSASGNPSDPHFVAGVTAGPSHQQGGRVDVQGLNDRERLPGPAHREPGPVQGGLDAIADMAMLALERCHQGAGGRMEGHDLRAET
jgi:hypothetical protein